MLQRFLSSQDKGLILRLFSENFKKHLRPYSFAILSMIVAGTATGASAAIMKNIIDSLISAKAFSQITLLSVTISFIFIVKGVASYLQTLFLSRAGNSIIAQQQRKLYDRLLAQGVAFFDQTAASDLLVRVTNSAQAARSVIDLLVTTYVRDLISLISLIFVMIYTNYWLALIAVIAGPIIFLFTRYLLKKVRRLTASEISSLAKIIQIIQETSIGIQVIKAFGLENYMRNSMDAAVKAVQDRTNDIIKLSAITNPLMETLAGLAIATIVAISGYMVLESHSTPGDLMAFITSLLLAYEPAKRLANNRLHLETGLIGVRMMFDTLDQPLTLREKDNAISLPAKVCDIIFKDVSFGYNAEQLIFEKLSLRIPAKKITALVGSSGAGKTTLTNLILRLYDPIEGQIFINGVDIADVTFSSLRQHISYIGQQSFLFQGSIRHNILLGRQDASEEEIIQAAKMAHAHEFIAKLPQGYDTILGENGNGLSGGQKQRLTIARAILRDSQILILDEATSALDSESEALVQKALEHLMQKRTTIIIAHRFSTIQKANNIIVLDHGKIVEQGSHADLLANDKSLYKKFHALQYIDKNRDTAL